jgi:hypothetical protein
METCPSREGAFWQTIPDSEARICKEGSAGARLTRLRRATGGLTVASAGCDRQTMAVVCPLVRFPVMLVPPGSLFNFNRVGAHSSALQMGCQLVVMVHTVGTAVLRVRHCSPLPRSLPSNYGSIGSMAFINSVSFELYCAPSVPACTRRWQFGQSAMTNAG